MGASLALFATVETEGRLPFSEDAAGVDKILSGDEKFQVGLPLLSGVSLWVKVLIIFQVWRNNVVGD